MRWFLTVLSAALLIPAGAQANKAAHVALVIDIHPSVRGFDTPGHAADFMSGLGIANPNDLAGVWAVSARDPVVAAMTSMTGADKTNAMSRTRRQRAKRRTRDVAQAVGQAVSHLVAFQDANVDGVPAVVLLHGGGHDGDAQALADLITTLGTAGVPVFAVALGSRADRGVLKALASRSGGVFYTAGSKGDLSPVLDRIATNIDRSRSGKPPADRVKKPPVKVPPPSNAPRALKCSNARGSVLSIREAGKSVVISATPDKEAKLFGRVIHRDIKNLKEISSLHITLKQRDCRFSADNPELVSCGHDKPIMFDLQIKDARPTLLATWFRVDTKRVEAVTVDGRTKGVQATLRIGDHNPRAKKGLRPPEGAEAVLNFKLSECRRSP